MVCSFRGIIVYIVSNAEKRDGSVPEPPRQHEADEVGIKHGQTQNVSTPVMNILLSVIKKCKEVKKAGERITAVSNLIRKISCVFKK